MKTCIALGFFDGVHIAHQKLICTAVSIAKEKNLSPLVLTFEKSPAAVLGKSFSGLITDNTEKIGLIRQLGAEVCLLDTSAELLSMDYTSFISDIICGRFNASHVVCGYNYRFGKNGAGSAKDLIVSGEKYGFETTVVEQTLHGNIPVSSSRIRSLIENGNVEEAATLLGRFFSVSGMVCEGKHLGRTLGFPTANVEPDSSLILPMRGVYQTQVMIDGKPFKAITNVGINPTFGDALRTETFIPDFSGDLYNKKLRIEFCRFIRPEIKFSDADALRMQIKKDVNSLKD